ncbi:MAG: HDOD domain-containing protein [Clostridium sp.]|nr:HDOD domain-containing protein [Clostridium sp.]
MEIFLARQAIYDKKGDVVAYELLFRDSRENYFPRNIDEEKATLKLISNCGMMGISKLPNNKKAFVNFPRGVLLKDVVSLLSSERYVVEILENVEPTEEILIYLSELKKKNYILALDDVSNKERCKDFETLIDIYIIDFVAANKDERSKIVEEIRRINPKAELLAEKIENEEEYEEAINLGYSYFQGYYFSKPVIVSGKDIEVKNLNCFNIMVELLNPDFSIDVVEDIIKSDVGISYKLIKFLNSSAFGFKQEITSIRQAIMMIGRKELKKWLSLLAISEIQGESNEQVTVVSIMKARFCELIAMNVVGDKSANAFLTGLFSNLDIFINKDMEEIIDEIPTLSEEVKMALLGKENVLGDILKLVNA